MRPIDADALIEKYKERKKLFCKNQIEFRMLSDKDKARVDELDNCIADVMNMPTIEPQQNADCVVCKHGGFGDPVCGRCSRRWQDLFEKEDGQDD